MFTAWVVSFVITLVIADLIYNHQFPTLPDGGREKSFFKHVFDCGLLYPGVFIWIVLAFATGGEYAARYLA